MNCSWYGTSTCSCSYSFHFSSNSPKNHHATWKKVIFPIIDCYLITTVSCRLAIISVIRGKFLKKPYFHVINTGFLQATKTQYHVLSYQGSKYGGTTWNLLRGNVFRFRKTRKAWIYLSPCQRFQPRQFLGNAPRKFGTYDPMMWGLLPFNKPGANHQ